METRVRNTRKSEEFEICARGLDKNCFFLPTIERDE